jgi:hypothetical protein
MPSHAHHRDAHHHDSVWSLEGRLAQLIYSPRGGIEGLLLDVDGTPAQFVLAPHQTDAAAGLAEGQHLVVEGTHAGPSPKGEAEHDVYHFERLVSVDGKVREAPAVNGDVSGTVVRFNYAKHGAANGVLLDSGDFVHTKPDGLLRLGLEIGSFVRAEGEARMLVTGAGRVVEARVVNGMAL